MSRKGSAPGSPQGPAANDAAAGGFGLGALAATLDAAALNMSLASLDGIEEAARHPSALAGADAGRALAVQTPAQGGSRGVGLAEVLPAARR